MKKLTLALSAAALALAGGAAYAQQGGMGSGMGPNRDATMTWDQVKAKADAKFAKMDVNGDGVLSQADREAMKAKIFDKIDTNHDGSISREEFMAAHGPRGDHGMGGPGDGQQMGHGKRGKWDHHGMRGHRGMGHRGGMMMLRMADTNHDGQVTKAEFDAAVKAHFDKVDANHDGKITKEERQAAHAALRAKMQQRWNDRGGMNGDDMPPPPPPGDGE